MSLRVSVRGIAIRRAARLGPERGAGRGAARFYALKVSPFVCQRAHRRVTLLTLLLTIVATLS